MAAVTSPMSNLAHLPADRATPADRTALEHWMEPLRPWLTDPSVTEICINSPGEAFIERNQFERLPLREATFEWCMRGAKLVANFTGQAVHEVNPLLSATLPGGERVKFVLPPVAPRGTVGIAIRIPSRAQWSLPDLKARGVFSHVVVFPDATRLRLADEIATADNGLSPVDRLLLAALAAGDIARFLRTAVIGKKNILLSGATGSGKTTVAKALIRNVPDSERIMAIEDARELDLTGHPNSMSLLYSQGSQGQAKVTVRDLLVAVKRLRPDRVFVSELRTGDEAYEYLVGVNSGHPGSITSIHANSAHDAFLALAQIIKTGEAGRGQDLQEVIALTKSKVDVVVQCARNAQGERCVSEIWYEPRT